MGDTIILRKRSYSNVALFAAIFNCTLDFLLVLGTVLFLTGWKLGTMQ